MDYDVNKMKLDKRIQECRDVISKLVYKDLVKQNSIFNKGSEALEVEFVIERRNKLIDQKVDHVLRVVEDVVKISETSGIPFDLSNVVQHAALLHDYGRFPQMTLMSTFNDSYFSKNGYGDLYTNHGQYGAHLLFNENEINKYGFDIDERYFDILKDTIIYHNEPVLPNNLLIKIPERELNSLMNKVSSLKPLSEEERAISALVAQLIQDVDGIDILYQYLTGEFKIKASSISRGIYNKYADKLFTIDDFANQYGVSKELLIEFNALDRYKFKLKDFVDSNIVDSKDILDYETRVDELYTVDEFSKKFNVVKDELYNNTSLIKMKNNLIIIPLDNVDPARLDIPLDIKERLLSGENIPLSELVSRPDYSQIVAFWWRLCTFINKINFTGFAKLIEEQDLIFRLEEIIPEDYKPYCAEVFDYAYGILNEKTNGNTFYSNNIKK